MKREEFAVNCIAAQARSGLYPFQIPIYLYIVEGILVDTGSAAILSQSSKLLQEVDIRCAALTHVHEDHTGAAPWIKEHLGVPVYLHESSIAEAAVPTKLPFYRKYTWGNRRGFVADPAPACLETENYRLDVIHAPGHHQDHLVFHEPNQGWLFTGDLYVGRKQFVAFKDENISDAIQSLRHLLTLDFETVFCAHSGIQKRGREKLQQKLNYFEEIQQQVVELRQAGLDYKEIDQKLFPKKGLWEKISRGEWTSLQIIKTACSS